MPMLYVSETSLGFQDGKIYDVPTLRTSKHPSAYPVSAIVFEVNCRAIPDLAQIGPPSVVSADAGLQMITYPFKIHEGLKNVNITPGKLFKPSLFAPSPLLITGTAAPSTLNILSPVPTDAQDTAPPTLIVAASGIQIVDDVSRVYQSTSPLVPEVLPDPSTCSQLPSKCSASYTL